MYIVKASHKGNALFRRADGYREVETEDQAITVYTKMITDFPFSVDVQVFKSEKIEMSPHILEEALKRKEEECKMKLKMLELGIDEYSMADDTGNVKEHWSVD